MTIAAEFLIEIQPQFAIFRLLWKIIADFPQRAAIQKTISSNLNHATS